jgi:transcriptional regulator with XRE-family HTH domain
LAEERDIVLNQIGLRIARRRQELGLTPVLAKRLHLPPPNVSRIENGQQNLTVGSLCSLANALETTVAELVAGPLEKPPAQR